MPPQQFLRESEERLRLAGKATRDVIWDWDVENDSQYWSASAAEVFGWTDAIDTPQTAAWWSDKVHPDDRDRVSRGFHAVVDDPAREHWEDEYRFMRRDGSVAHVLDRGFVIRDAGGKARRMIGAMQDITERKQAEQELRNQREDLDRAQAVAHVGSWRLDVRRNVLRWSDESYRIAGIPPGTPMSYEAFLAIVHPDDRAYVDQKWRAALRGEPYDIEHRMLVRGEVRWAREQAQLEFGADGELLGGFGAFHDITERKQAEARLQEQAELLDLAHDAIIVRSTDGSVIFWNHGAEQAYGWSRDEAVGKATHSLLRTEFPVPLPQIEAALVRNGWWEGTLHHTRRDGRRIAVASRWTLRREPDKSDVVLEINNDITQQEEAERHLLDADRRKNEFLATLAHELRNPLAPIRNAVQVLTRRGPPDPQLVSAGAVIERQVRHMIRLLDDLLDVSRISHDKLELRKERVELAEIVRSALETSRPLIEGGGHEFTLTLPPEPVFLDVDPVRLAQVFSNLLNNAAKYTGPGGHIRFACERRGNEVVASVRDDGIGIDAETLPRLFAIFSQDSRSLERSQGGLGIGLALVRRLVELHGGSVEAHSDGPGKGTEFVVRLPVAAAQVAPAGCPALAADAPATTRRRLLIVDDLKDNADALAMLLSMMGHEVHVAYDGEGAVLAAESFRPDVILLDIGMPKLNGYDACRQIRAQPWGEATYVIAVTGWGQDEDRRRAEAAGFDLHLVKPVDPDELMRLLASLPERHKAAVDSRAVTRRR